MTVTVLNPVPHGSSMRSTDTGVNVEYDDVNIDMGDDGTVAGPDIRHSMGHIFDLTPLGVPKGHIIIDDVRIIVGSTGAQSAGGGDADHRLALFASTGGWDRSTLHPLHQSNSGVVYGNPGRAINVRAKAYGFNHGQAADTMVGTGGATELLTSSAVPTIGTTFQFSNDPGGDLFWQFELYMRRIDGVSSDNLVVNVYTLAQQGRQYAIDTLLCTTTPKPYSALSTLASYVNWQVAGPVPGVDDGTWLAAVIEGDWFTSGASKSARRIGFHHIVEPNDKIFHVDSGGSAFTADASAVNDNSLSNVGYMYSTDIPNIYPFGTTLVRTAPFLMHEGAVQIPADDTVTWANADYNYGSAGSGQLNVLPSIVSRMNTWFNSGAYDPLNGKTKIGVMLDIRAPDNLLWTTAGSGHATRIPCKLELTWHKRAKMTITSFGTEPSLTVESMAVEPSFTAESKAVEPSFTIESEANEASMTAESKATEPSLTKTSGAT